MEAILSLLNEIVKADSQHINIYLEALAECQCFQSKHDGAVHVISSLLSKGNSRAVGLKLLANILDQCTIDVLEQRANLWISLVLKAASTEQEIRSYPSLIYDNLAKLSELMKLSSDLIKSFSSNYLSKIYESLSIVSSEGYYSALSCVKVCLQYYPGSSLQSRGQIERFLVRLVDCGDQFIVTKSADCWLLLQQTRSSANNKLQWKDYQLRLLGSLHSIFDKAFANCKEIYYNVEVNEQLNIPELNLSSEPVRKTAQLTIRFCNIADYLRIALIEPFPAVKPICMKKILNLINRGLNVTSESLLKTQTSDNIALAALITRIHAKLLELLEALIMVLGGHLRTQNESVYVSLVDTLHWTSSTISKGTKKSYENLRCITYRVIRLWCVTINGGGLCESISERIIKQILLDVMPFQNDFTLKVHSGAKKYMSKNARRKLNKLTNAQTNLSQTHSNESLIRKENISDEGNQLLCVAALQCLQTLLFSANCAMRPSTLKILQSKCLKICALFYELPLSKEQMYYHSKCRLEMFKTLYQLVMNPHHLCPPPTQLIVKILEDAHIRDIDFTVRNDCLHMLKSIEKLIHPLKEALLFPIELKDIKKAFDKFGQTRLLNGNIFYNETTSDYEENNDKDDALVQKEIVIQELHNTFPTNDLHEVLSQKTTETDIDSIHLTIDDKDLKSSPMHNTFPTDGLQEVYILSQKISTEADICSLHSTRDDKDLKNSPKEIISEIKKKRADVIDIAEDFLTAPPLKQLKQDNISKDTNEENVLTKSSFLTQDESVLIADLEAAFVDELN